MNVGNFQEQTLSFPEGNSVGKDWTCDNRDLVCPKAWYPIPFDRHDAKILGHHYS